MVAGGGCGLLGVAGSGCQGLLLDGGEGGACLDKVQGEALQDAAQLLVAKHLEGGGVPSHERTQPPPPTLSMSLSRVPRPGPNSTSCMGVVSPRAIQSANTHTASSCMMKGGMDQESTFFHPHLAKHLADVW